MNGSNNIKQIFNLLAQFMENIVLKFCTGLCDPCLRRLLRRFIDLVIKPLEGKIHGCDIRLSWRTLLHTYSHSQKASPVFRNCPCIHNRSASWETNAQIPVSCPNTILRNLTSIAVPSGYTVQYSAT